MIEAGETQLPPQAPPANVVDIIKDKSGRLHELVDGPRPDLVEQLVALSGSDPGTMKFTRDSERFASTEAFDTWHEERDVLWMTHEEQLSGVIFFGPKQPSLDILLPVVTTNPHTMGIRVYDGYSANGLGTQLMNVGHWHYLEKFAPADEPDLIWVESQHDNPAVGMYERFGYKPYAFDNGSGTSLMYLPLNAQVAHPDFKPQIIT